MTEWIRSADRLPDRYGRYLVRLKPHWWRSARFKVADFPFEQGWGWLLADGITLYNNEYTHWLSIPPFEE